MWNLHRGGTSHFAKIRNIRITTKRFQSSTNEPQLNKNAAGIQQLSDELHQQIFPHKSLSGPTNALTKVALKYLKDNELLGKPCSENTPINLKLPTLQGNNINHHFQNLGYKSSEKYDDLIDNLMNIGNTPLPKPAKWEFKSGWTRYAPNKPPESVPYPLEQELVYDCEVMYKVASFPVMATCLSPVAWYSWCSPFLTGESTENNHLIPMGTNLRESVIVGHNVSFDRARVLEEYSMESTKCFYLDTMSLHVAVSGMCSRQRGTWMKYKKNQKEKVAEEKTLDDLRYMIENEELRYTMSNLILDQESNYDENDALHDDPWMKSSSMNKLSDVADFYCGIKMQKQLRDHFATLDIQELRDLFQDLMSYCADDVIATYHVFNKVYPKFKAVVPHPVSFAALRHITTSFLPTSTDWEDYIHRCEKMYQESKNEVETKIHAICKDVVDLRLKAEEQNPPWESDPWLSQLDWTITPQKLTKAGLPYKSQKLPGYPEWYKKLVLKNELNLTIKTRCASLLLRLLWEKKPIFWTETKGWCFIVNRKDMDEFVGKKYKMFEPAEILNEFESTKNSKPKKATSRKPQKKLPVEEELIVDEETALDNAKPVKSSRKKTKTKVEPIIYEDIEEVEVIPYAETDTSVRTGLEKLISQNDVLFKIPHENGVTARVTSLITKPFLRYYEDGVLSSENKLAKEAFQTNVTNSYWVSSRERIMNQFVVYESTLKGNKSKLTNEKELGFIIPQIIPMGTITRRAVEKTWLTASNAKKNRLGSELKSLVQAPPGYCFVGADVDSEELWIASLVGDSTFKLHGGTALGWMTLEGTKNAGTDLHSKTANILGISRNEAKVFNYGRIYGAGVKFATSLLKKFNPSITDEKADEVAKTLYAETKGNTSFFKFPNTEEKVKVWYGGSESVVFNRLESIAEQDDPKTPVLGAGITAALNRTNLNTNSFLPSRINWAIQSSGVDYLHLLLISMEHLSKIYNIELRLAITVHDEVRYICKEEDKYRVSMMLQIANLWTRAMFCFQLGIENIPQSCAFFSCVDIDSVLRKEVDFDCLTPSNPIPIPHGESIDIYQLLEKEEVQKMLNDLNDSYLPSYRFNEHEKLKRPVEALDKKLDASTKLSWIKLQISKTEKEFKQMKKKFFDSSDMLVLSKFEKTLPQLDNKSDDVVCEGFVDGVQDSGELLNAGVVLEQHWDSIIGKDTQKKSRKVPAIESGDTETSVDLYLDMIASNMLVATEPSKKSNKNTATTDRKSKPKTATYRKVPKIKQLKTEKVTSPSKTANKTLERSVSKTKEKTSLKSPSSNNIRSKRLEKTSRAVSASKNTHHHSHLSMDEMKEITKW